MRVAVLGTSGRMGSMICETLRNANSVEFVDIETSRASGDASVTPKGLRDVDVIVDVTNAQAARVNLPVIAAAGVHAVVGTTGFHDSDVATFDSAFKSAGKSCFLVPNFAIGAVLMMRFAQEAAPYFDGVEIVELHHDQKKDMPSGTAKLTAKRIGGEVPIHSVRLRGLVAHQEVILGTTGQSLTIRHDSYDRSAFMPGMLMAVDKVSMLQPGITQGLEAVL